MRTRKGHIAVKLTTLAAVVLMLVVVSPLFADARVSSVDGLVQFRVPGAGSWDRLSTGMVVPEGSTVISGVNGNARLDAGNSTIEVAPLSRVVVETVQITAAQETAALSMPYGRVRAQVRRSRERGMDFSVYTPISTAAVRGTEFVFDGRQLSVTEGDVALFNTLGQEHSVRAGQVSRVWADEPIQSVEATLADQF